MHNDYKIIYDDGLYLIADENAHFSVYKFNKQLASFNDKQVAFDYVYDQVRPRGGHPGHG